MPRRARLLDDVICDPTPTGSAPISGLSLLDSGYDLEPAFEDRGALPGIDRRVSLVLAEEVIAGTLRSWSPLARIELDHATPTPLPSRGLLQYMSSEGVLHYRGSLAADGSAWSHGVLFRPEGPPQLLLARRRLRAELKIPLTVTRQDGSSFDTFTANIGESGVLIGTPSNLKVGDPVSLKVRLDLFSAPIAAVATIVRLADNGYAAAHFTEITKEARERLGWRIFDHLLSTRQQPRR